MTVRRLFRISGHPLLDFFQLLSPLPRYYPVPTPIPTPVELRDNPDLVLSQQGSICIWRIIPLWRRRDTPERCLYRMYEDFCANFTSLVADEIEYFWHHTGSRWKLRNVKNPRDKNPERSAVLASLVETLVDMFNWRLGKGMRRDGTVIHVDVDGNPATFTPEETPPWVGDVSALKNTLTIHNRGQSSIFLKRNIDAFSGDLCVRPSCDWHDDTYG